MKFSTTLVTLLLSAASYAQKSTLDSGLVACYPFSGNAHDMSNHGNDGIIHGATLAADRFGKPNSAFSFIRNDSAYIEIPKFGGKLNATEFGISFWINSNIIADQSPFLLMPDNPSNRFNIHTFYSNYGTQSVFLDYGDIYSNGRAYCADSSSLHHWHHYAMTSSNSKDSMVIYIDGKIVFAQNSSSIFTNDSSRYLQIGGGVASNGFSQFIDGTLDDIKIYNRALSNAEVVTLYHSNFSCEGDTTKACNLTIAAALTHTITCNNSCNGVASASIITGTSTPFTYKWSNGATTADANNLCSGNYSVTVTDGKGCSNIAAVNISEPSKLGVSLSSTSSRNNDGTAKATATGGTLPYQYQWSNGMTTATISGLKSGTYYVTVSDSSNCSTTESIVVTRNTTGITEGLTTASEVKIYPSIAADKIHIETTGFNMQRLIIYNQIGLKMLDKIGETDEVNISSWPTGIYFISFLGKNNSIVQNKFVVSR